MKIFNRIVSMMILIEYHDSRYLLVELTGSAVKHRALPSARAKLEEWEKVGKDKYAGMTLILLDIYIYIYIKHKIICH